MTGAADDRIRGLLAEGRDLLRKGQSREAADAFGRVLLHNPDDPAARQGLEKARAAAAEEERQLDARMDEARRAIGAGDRDEARRLLEEVVRRGGDRDRALALLDRLAEHDGRLEPAPRPAEEVAVGEAASSPPPRPAWSRRAFALAWALVFAVLAAGLAASWDPLVESLVRTPSPGTRVAEPAADRAASASAGREAAP